MPRVLRSECLVAWSAWQDCVTHHHHHNGQDGVEYRYIHTVCHHHGVTPLAGDDCVHHVVYVPYLHLHRLLLRPVSVSAQLKDILVKVGMC